MSQDLTQLRAEITELEELNMNQNILIQALLRCMGNSKKRNQMYNLMINATNSASNQDELLQIIQQIKERVAKFPKPTQESNSKIIELQKQINEVEEKIRSLDNKLALYNEQAQQYEELLAENEQQKAKLLASFQQNQNNNFEENEEDNIQFKELQQKAQDLLNEKLKMLNEQKQSQSLIDEVNSQISKSEKTVKKYEARIKAVKSQLSRNSSSFISPDQLEHIDDEIERLTKEYDQKTQILTRLKNENKILRERIQNPSSSSNL